MKTSDVTTAVITPADPRYLAAEGLVKACYQRTFGSSHHHRFPRYFAVVSGKSVLGCAGFCGAGDARVFLEDYLDLPLAPCVSASLGRNIERARIVEVGSLALRYKWVAVPLMTQLAIALEAQAFEVVACTVTRPVATCLARLGIRSVKLASASATRVPEGDAWGDYYSKQPVVLAGEIGPAIRAMGLREAA